jgi:hypothetical protein
MNEVQKPSNTECYTSSSEPFRTYNKFVSKCAPPRPPPDKLAAPMRGTELPFPRQETGHQLFDLFRDPVCAFKVKMSIRTRSADTTDADVMWRRIRYGDKDVNDESEGISRYSSGICLERLRKIMKIILS